MDLRQCLELLRRRWWLILLLPALAGLGGYYGSKQLPQVYLSTTTVLVNQTQAAGVIQYNDILTSERLTSTYAQLVERRPVLSQVISRLSLSWTEEELEKKITVSPVRNTQLLRIAVEDEDPLLATSIANTTARLFIADNAAQTGSRPGTVSIAEEAYVPLQPAKPNVQLNTILAVVCGLLVAGVFVLVLEYLDDTVKGRDVEVMTGLPTLATIARSPSRRLKASISRNETNRPDLWEQYRQLRTSVHFSMLGQKGKSILVTSTNAGEGKTTTALGLAVVLAQTGHHVVIVDADLRRPTLHEWFQCPNSVGLTGLVLQASKNPLPALVKTRIANLWLLPAGPQPPNPSELLMSKELWSVIDQVKEFADYLVFDSPPLLPVTDASIIAAQVDATILVAESSKTRWDAFQRAQAALMRSNTKLIGVVINKVKRGRHSGGYHAYGHQVEGGPEKTKATQRGKRTALPAVASETKSEPAAQGAFQPPI